MIVIGIDPGRKGAVALLHPDGDQVFDMPLTAAALAQEFRNALYANDVGDIVVYIEQQQAFPGNAAGSNFKLGYNQGWIEGVCSTLGYRVEYVRPAKWKKHFRLDSDKEKSRALAQQKWPGLSGDLARKKDEGRAESLLIACWGQIQERGRDAE